MLESSTHRTLSTLGGLTESEWQVIERCDHLIADAFARQDYCAAETAIAEFEQAVYAIVYAHVPLPFGLRQVGPSTFLAEGTDVGDLLWPEPMSEQEIDERWSQMAEADRSYATTKPQRRRTKACQAMRDDWALRMPFGKHRGQPVASLPVDYLQWLKNSSVGLKDELRAEVERVLKGSARHVGG
jgi:hypothetical protein